MSALSIFQFQNHTVRILLDENNTPLFVASDVAKALGYSHLTSAIKRFCKGVAKHHTLQTAGGTQKVRVIYEPDVYRLIFGSKLDSAINFQDWVFEEVLPSIRKTGKYEQPTDRLTDEQVGYLYHNVMRICSETNQAYQSVFSALKREFCVASYKHIKPSDFSRACAFLNIPLPTASPQERTVTISETEAWNLTNAYFDAHRQEKLFSNLYDLMDELKKLMPSVYSEYESAALRKVTLGSAVHNISTQLKNEYEWNNRLEKLHKLNPKLRESSIKQQ